MLQNSIFFGQEGGSLSFELSADPGEPETSEVEDVRVSHQPKTLYRLGLRGHRMVLRESGGRGGWRSQRDLGVFYGCEVEAREGRRRLWLYELKKGRSAGWLEFAEESKERLREILRFSVVWVGGVREELLWFQAKEKEEWTECPQRFNGVLCENLVWGGEASSRILVLKIYNKAQLRSSGHESALLSTLLNLRMLESDRIDSSRFIGAFESSGAVKLWFRAPGAPSLAAVKRPEAYRRLVLEMGEVLERLERRGLSWPSVDPRLVFVGGAEADQYERRESTNVGRERVESTASPRNFGELIRSPQVLNESTRSPPNLNESTRSPHLNFNESIRSLSPRLNPSLFRLSFLSFDFLLSSPTSPYSRVTFLTNLFPTTSHDISSLSLGLFLLGLATPNESLPFLDPLQSNPPSKSIFLNLPYKSFKSLSPIDQQIVFELITRSSLTEALPRVRRLIEMKELEGFVPNSFGKMESEALVSYRSESGENIGSSSDSQESLPKIVVSTEKLDEIYPAFRMQDDSPQPDLRHLAPILLQKSQSNPIDPN